MNINKFVARLNRFKADEKGVVAIEMAIAGGVLAAVMIGVVEYGSALRDRRAIDGAAAAAAESIADSAMSSQFSRADLDKAIQIINANASTRMQADVYHVVSDSSGSVSMAHHWSTGTNVVQATTSEKDWQLIKPYLASGEGGVVVCTYMKRRSIVTVATSTLKSCHVGVPVKSMDIDWRS